ncbi:MAG: GIY-YIG nuclease family protein [Propionibacteriaceae bacterium]
MLEIADRDKIPFPGFDRVLLRFHELQEMTTDHRYADWRAALSEVQGIYLITDSLTGKQYVGKADGGERILGRWVQYAHDGHGGNLSLRELAAAGTSEQSARTEHARHFVFSILRVFGPSTSPSEIAAAESHYKNALMTREFGLNRN